MFAVTHGRGFAFPWSIRRGLRPSVLIAAALLTTSVSSRGGDAISPYVETRALGVVRQTNSFSCGAAAVATLLSAIFGQPVSESEILALVATHVADLGIPMTDGIPALSLVFALTACGMPAAGYKLDRPALRDYFTRGGLPVIAHVLEPEKHFVVVVGLVRDVYVLADPGWGWVRDETFMKFRAFSGVTLVPLPAPDLAEVARIAQIRILEAAEQRLERLTLLREWLP
jgi:predicted double-glycine peptidase